MHYTQEQLFQFLEEHQISYQLYRHEPVFTCEQAFAIIAEMNVPGIGIKNLFLKDSKKNFYHIVAIDSTRVDLKITGKTLQAKDLRFADANLLMQYLGVQPGSVTPLALINDKNHEVQVVLDSEIFKHEFIQIHPLKNDATIVITPGDLIKFLGLIDRSYRVYDFVSNQIIA
jgi:Ala-tRNA(Pro) deacylase